MNQYNRVGIYDYVRFDAVLNDVYVESCNSNLTRNENVDALLKTFYIGGPVYRENDESFVSTTLIVDSDNFNSFFNIFPQKHFIKIDKSLLNQKNSVFISENISKSCNVHIGDLIEIQGIWHKVCGIYEQAITNVINATAVILWNGNYTNGTSVSGIKDGIVDYFDIYTRVYIKFKNYDSGIKWVRDNAFDHRIFLNDVTNHENFSLYLEQKGKDWAKWAIDTALTEGTFNIDEYRIGAYDTKARMSQLAKQDYESMYNVKDDYFYAALCLIALFTVCTLESYRYAKLNMKKIAILRILGCSKVKITTTYFIRSFFIQLLLMLGAILFAITMTSKNRTFSYVLVTKWFASFVLIITISAILGAIASSYQLKDRKLLKKLNEESK